MEDWEKNKSYQKAVKEFKYYLKHPERLTGRLDIEENPRCPICKGAVIKFFKTIINGQVVHVCKKCKRKHLKELKQIVAEINENQSNENTLNQNTPQT